MRIWSARLGGKLYLYFRWFILFILAVHVSVRLQYLSIQFFLSSQGRFPGHWRKSELLESEQYIVSIWQYTFKAAPTSPWLARVSQCSRQHRTRYPKEEIYISTNIIRQEKLPAGYFHMAGTSNSSKRTPMEQFHRWEQASKKRTEPYLPHWVNQYKSSLPRFQTSKPPREPIAFAIGKEIQVVNSHGKIRSSSKPPQTQLSIGRHSFWVGKSTHIKTNLKERKPHPNNNGPSELPLRSHYPPEPQPSRSRTNISK